VLAALLYGPEDLRLETVADPTPGPGELVMQVTTATTCGTDLKVWRQGSHARMLKPPTLFGHEAVGKIVEIGAGVTGWQINDRIVANNSAPCMQCFFCQRQEFSLCPHLCFNNGTFAEYLRIPAPIVQHNVLPIPDHLPDALAALTEPLACVLHGIDRSNLRSTGTLPQRVVVIGDGAIGLMFVAALQTYPVEILLVGGHETRLQIGQKMGATEVVNHHHTTDLPTVVKEWTAGWGADVVIEATGSPRVWETAIACTRPGGTTNVFGGCPRDTTITVSTEQLHYNELTLKGVFHNTPTHVRAALALLARRSSPFELLISDHQPLTQLEQVFQGMKARQIIKAAIYPLEVCRMDVPNTLH
jgi:L-iditol 2-dehydrogenase